MSVVNPYTINNSFKEHWKPCLKGVSYSCKWVLLSKPDMHMVKVASLSLKRIIGVSLLLDTTVSAAKTQEAAFQFSHEVSLENFKTFSRCFMKTLRGSCNSSASLLPLKGRMLNSVVGIGTVCTILLTIDDLYMNVKELYL